MQNYPTSYELHRRIAVAESAAELLASYIEKSYATLERAVSAIVLPKNTTTLEVSEAPLSERCRKAEKACSELINLIDLQQAVARRYTTEVARVGEVAA